jgi:hypothetical protein
MSANWVTSDGEIVRELSAYRTLIGSDPDWNCDLFTNTPTDPMSTDIADYTIADFDGYAQQSFAPSTFGSVTITAHVAKTISSTVLTFSSSALATPQVVKGYVLTDSGGVLLRAEQFENPVTVNPTNDVNITPELRHTNLPA